MAAYYDEKHKTWYCKFRYTDWQGNSKSTSKRGFKTKKEALKYEADKKESAKEVPTMGMKNLADEFLADYKIRRKPNSYLATEKNIRLYILPYLGNLAVTDITPLVIRKWQNTLAEKKLSDSLLYTINTTLNTLLNHAVKLYNLPSNPLKRTGKQGKVGKRLVFLELSEWKTLDKAIDNIYYRTLFTVMYWTGLRIGEVLGLTEKDIDFERNVIHITKQMGTDNKPSTPKTKHSIRDINIPQFLTDLLKRYLASHYYKVKYIFNLESRMTINNKLHKYCRLAGVTDITVHGLRHSHASFLISQGIPINSIAQRLGHASPTMTLNIYSHCYKSQDRDIANLIDTIK